jgi:hydroxymethylpyrimidine pyrophosphatase-like HAD family hydrolase
LDVRGLHFSMSNAPEELKAIAGYAAVPVEEEGLTVAIEQFLSPSC